jgi:hypothetical protein
MLNLLYICNMIIYFNMINFFYIQINLFLMFFYFHLALSLYIFDIICLFEIYCPKYEK